MDQLGWLSICLSMGPTVSFLGYGSSQLAPLTTKQAFEWQRKTAAAGGSLLKSATTGVPMGAGAWIDPGSRDEWSSWSHMIPKQNTCREWKALHPAPQPLAQRWVVTAQEVGKLG